MIFKNLINYWGANIRKVYKKALPGSHGKTDIDPDNRSPLLKS